MPPTTTRASTPKSAQALQHSGTSSRWRAREDGEPHDVDVLVAGRRRDLLRGQPDALVDTSKPASLAATAICSAPFECPSSPGLATSRRGGVPCAPTSRGEALEDGRQLVAPPAHRPRYPGRGRGTRRTPREARWPTRPSCLRRAPGRSSACMMLSLAVVRPPGAARRGPARPAPGRGRPATGPRRRLSSASTAGSTLRTVRPKRRRRPRAARARVSVKQLTPTTVCSPGLDAPHPLGLAAHEPGLSSSIGRERTAQRQDVVQLGRRPPRPARRSWPR